MELPDIVYTVIRYSVFKEIKIRLNYTCNRGFARGAMVKNLPANARDTRQQVRSLGWDNPLEKEMATCSSILAWRSSWTEEPGRLLSMGSKKSQT